MRLTRKRSISSHTITEKLVSIDAVEFVEDCTHPTCRCRDHKQVALKEAEITAARQKIESQKRNLEGSAEWEIVPQVLRRGNAEPRRITFVPPLEPKFHWYRECSSEHCMSAEMTRLHAAHSRPYRSSVSWSCWRTLN
jgi:hypothetical protein